MREQFLDVCLWTSGQLVSIKRQLLTCLPAGAKMNPEHLRQFSDELDTLRFAAQARSLLTKRRITESGVCSSSA
jgi:hypothetical protein